MSKRVSDMVKMYNQTQLKHTGDKPAVARKWPPIDTAGGGGKPPPVTPKPKALTPHANGGGTLGRPSTGPKPFGSDVPQWKKDLHRNRTDSGGSGSKPFVKYGSEPRESDPLPPWKQRMAEKDQKPKDEIPPWKQRMQEEEPKQENIPLWKQRLNKAQEDDDKTKNENTPPWNKKPAQDEKKDVAPWLKQRQENNEKPPPPWAPKPTKPDATTPSWSERNKNANTAAKGYNTSQYPPPPPGNKPDLNNSLGRPRNNQQSKSLTHNDTSSTSERRTSTSSDSSGVPGSPKHRVSSFLHTKQRTPSVQSQGDRPPRTPTPPRGKSPRVNGAPPKKSLPSEVYSMPPPIKTSKPPRVVLPSRGKKKTSPLPPPPISIAPPPSMALRPLPPPSSSSRGLPPPPGGMRDLPPQPNLAPSLPDRFPPPSPAKSRDLPPPPSPSMGRKSSPLPPAPMEVDDIYDDAADEPPPLPAMNMPPPPLSAMNMPPPLIKQESSGMIPTWEDEDDTGEALYDETPDDIPKPPLPAGFPVPGAPAAIPQSGEELYEDPEAEAYMRLKKMQAAESAASNNDKKDKKKKDSEKKEKDVKKKFKIKGDITVEGHGVAKENCRGWGKDLGVSAGENIEIIRMNDNPKGKWLVRNEEGSYGYVDSEKVTININDLRNTFGVGSKGSGATSAAPPPIPTDDDEVIYDQTADEDLYEEL